MSRQTICLPDRAMVKRIADRQDWQLVHVVLFRRAATPALFRPYLGIGECCNGDANPGFATAAGNSTRRWGV
jgi:hypothetical protein